MYDYDIIYIGSGNAAWQGGRFLRAAGKRVLVVEEDRFGGTCTNYGCNPKILLDGPYELKSAFDRYDGKGKTDDININWPSLMKFKEKQIDGLCGFVETLLHRYDFDVVKGHGKIIDKHTVNAGGKNYTTKIIVIATGLKPIMLDIKGKEYLKDSTDFLSVPELPENTVIIGAGINSLEFSSILAEAGNNVDIIVHSDKVLRRFHQQYVEKIIKNLEDKNVKFHYNQSVKEVIREDDDTYTVVTEDDDKYTADYVICAVGREAKVDNLGLENVGLEYSKDGIPVNGYMQTSIPNIYASGDIADSGQAKLVTVAIYQSKYIAKHLLGETDMEIDYPIVPEVVYTLPRIARVGVKADDVEDSDDYEIHQLKYGKSYAIELKNEKDAEMTVVTDTDKNIKGVEIYSSEADNLVNLFTIMMNKDIKLNELDDMIFAFPSSNVVALYKLHNIWY